MSQLKLNYVVNLNIYRKQIESLDIQVLIYTSSLKLVQGRQENRQVRIVKGKRVENLFKIITHYIDVNYRFVSSSRATCS